MKEINITIKVDDDYTCGDCTNCRFGHDMKYDYHKNKFICRCKIYSAYGEYITNPNNCPLKK